MNDETDWVMRPVVRGMITYDKMLGGAVTMIDVARMNEALDVKDENEQRMIDAAKGR